jgi:hypothetical protein
MVLMASFVSLFHQQLADEEDVDAFRNLGAQRRIFGERRIRRRRPQVGKAAKLLPNLQQAGFGALVGRQGVELVVAHRAQQDGVGFEAGGDGRLGQRRSFGGDGDAADQGFGEAEVVAAELGDSLENFNGFAGDFGADAVSGEDCDLQLHSGSFKFGGESSDCKSLDARLAKLAKFREEIMERWRRRPC